MQQPVSVGGVDGAGQVSEQRERTLGLERPGARERRPEILALHVPEHEIKVPVLLARAIHRAHVGMIERRGESHLGEEPVAESLVCRKLGRHHLERDEPTERLFSSEEDEPHPAAPEHPLQPEAGDCGAGSYHQSHRGL